MKHDVFSATTSTSRAALEACLHQLADHERFTLAGEWPDRQSAADRPRARRRGGRENTVGHHDGARPRGGGGSRCCAAVARNCLQRIADERSCAVKAALARPARHPHPGGAQHPRLPPLRRRRSGRRAGRHRRRALAGDPRRSSGSPRPTTARHGSRHDRSRAAAATRGSEQRRTPRRAFLFEQLDDESVPLRRRRRHRSSWVASPAWSRRPPSGRARGGRPSGPPPRTGGWLGFASRRARGSGSLDMMMPPGNRGLGAGVPVNPARRPRDPNVRWCGGPNLPGARSAPIWPAAERDILVPWRRSVSTVSGCSRSLF